MSKAKSRLHRNPTQTVPPVERHHVTEENNTPATTPRHSTRGSFLLTRYLRQLPTLLMSLPFGGAVFYVMTRVYPEKIAHFLWPNSYLLLLLPFFLWLFWVLSFIFLNARRGLMLSFMFTFFLFFRLHQVLFTWQVILLPLCVLGGLELIFTLFKSRAT